MSFEHDPLKISLQSNGETHPLRGEGTLNLYEYYTLAKLLIELNNKSLLADIDLFPEKDSEGFAHLSYVSTDPQNKLNLSIAKTEVEPIGTDCTEVVLECTITSQGYAAIIQCLNNLLNGQTYSEFRIGPVTTNLSMKRHGFGAQLA
jgi:hypothetical protein